MRPSVSSYITCRSLDWGIWNRGAVGLHGPQARFREPCWRMVSNSDIPRLNSTSFPRVRPDGC